jgi:thioredoxin reductase (NADPH)
MQPVLLAVDDDAGVREAVTRDLLQRYGESYRVLAAASGVSAVQELRRLKLRGVPVALVLSDQRMPGMSGVDLLRHAALLYPDARRVMLTAYADSDAAIGAINKAGVQQFLLKPWTPAEERLYPVLDELLDDWQSTAAPAVGGLRVVSSRWSADGHHLRDYLERNRVPHRWLDLEADDEAAALLQAASSGTTASPAGRTPSLPLVIFDDGSILERPAAAELAQRIGLSTNAQAEVYDVVIVGAGPAGLAAAVHASAEGYRVLLVERDAPGGQAGLSAHIENYLGFPVGLSGADLARRALAQAKRFGAELVTPVAAIGVRLDGGQTRVQLSNGDTVRARALLIAAGVAYRRLDVPGADRLVGRGVYYGGALTEAVRVSGRDVHVLGGGNSAGQAALHLARFARSVTLLVRPQSLASSMSRYLRDRLAATPNVVVRTGCNLLEVQGEAHLETLVLRDEAVGAVDVAPSFGLFVFIGASAATEWLSGVVQRDPQGFILSGGDVMRGGQRPAGWSAPRDPFLLETSAEGIFAAGDVRRRLIRGVAAAVGEGNMAAQLIHQHLTGLALRPRRAAAMAGS